MRRQADIWVARITFLTIKAEKELTKKEYMEFCEKCKALFSNELEDKSTSKIKG